MLLNADLGEGKSSTDRHIIKLVDMASIACGGHAGDEISMRTCVEAARHHGVKIGAHPSYPDKQNFGRTSQNIPPRELKPILQRQINALLRVCTLLDSKMDFIKAHGALYNDMLKDDARFAMMLELAEEYKVALVTQAGIDNLRYRKLAEHRKVPLIFEAFADRRYEASGHLRSREHENSMLTQVQHVLAQVEDLSKRNQVKSHSGKHIGVSAECLCVHGDTPDALALVQAIRDLFRE